MAIPLVDLKAQYKTIEHEIKEAIEEVLESQWFILGPNVSKLEEEVAEYKAHHTGCHEPEPFKAACIKRQQHAAPDPGVDTQEEKTHQQSHDIQGQGSHLQGGPLECKCRDGPENSG